MSALTFKEDIYITNTDEQKQTQSRWNKIKKTSPKNVVQDSECDRIYKTLCVIWFCYALSTDCFVISITFYCVLTLFHLKTYYSVYKQKRDMTKARYSFNCEMQQYAYVFACV